MIPFRSDDDDRAWMVDALCRQVSPEFFYPQDGENGTTAKTICNGTATREACPVRAECLAYALRHGDRYGIWGGTSERDRRRMPDYRANRDAS